MYLASRGFISSSVIALVFAFQCQSIQAQTVVESPDQILGAATKASLEGNYQEALANARKALAASNGNLNFASRFIGAVADIADLSDRRHRASLLNEALKAANSLEVSKIADGTQNAEFAYHYMVAVGKLGDALAESNPKIAKQIYLAESKVAANLRKNPGFPKESIAVLADPLMSAAYSRAIASDVDGTLASMKIAFDAGFTNYEELHENELVKSLDSKKVQQLINDRFANYEAELSKWARESVAKFKAFDFKFDVADIDAGRIRHSDFHGRILVLDLWATWCQPCREAIPHFVKLDQEFQGENVDVVGVSMDNPDNPGKSLKVVRNFVDDNGVEYAMAMGDRSMMNQLAPGQKLPTVLFIDASGKVRFIAEGPHNFHQLSAITNELIRQSNDSPTGIPVLTW